MTTPSRPTSEIVAGAPCCIAGSPGVSATSAAPRATPITLIDQPSRGAPAGGATEAVNRVDRSGPKPNNVRDASMENTVPSAAATRPAQPPHGADAVAPSANA